MEQDSPSSFLTLPKVLDYLRLEGLIPPCERNDDEPDDVTRESLEFPSSRSQRLQILTRGQTGAVTSLAYAVIRGYGALHPTVGELRVGKLPVYISHPYEEGEEEDGYYIGDVKVTEVEMLIPVTVEKEYGKKEIEFEIGYGICYGQNETKAIAMSILDNCLENPHHGYPSHDEEFVLYHIDSVESTGFISHLKMPHYVTFQSKLDSVRKTKKQDEEVKEKQEVKS
jgi:alpha-D-ribose 1-methylphosphonate 5-triphosphate synthase subunit PhnI